MPTDPRSDVDNDCAVNALRTLGIGSGATLYVAASLAGLTLLPDPVGLVLAALDAVVGPRGTVVMPTFHPGFRYEGAFDRELTPSRSGVLSEAFRTLPGTVRTWSPPYNPVAARGALAEALADIRSPTAFGQGSVFDRLVELDAVVLLVGCGFHDGVAHVHWLEERHDVPYREWRDCTGRVVLNGVPTWRTWPCHVRKPGVELNAGPVGEVLAAAGAVRETDLALARLSAFSLRDFVDGVDRWFADNPAAMVVR
jgi:aminoglycoside N3'-acetyltransferase